MSTRLFLEKEPLFVLHRKHLGEDSLLLDCLTRNYGRVNVFARGARRAYSVFGRSLLPFQPLTVNCSGNQLLQLTHVEHIRVFPFLSGRKLWAGLYVNELVIYFLPREDTMRDLFSLYCDTIEALVGEESDFFDGILRRFEINLLKVMGYSICFQSLSGDVEPDRLYAYSTASGAFCFSSFPSQDIPVVSGQTLINLSLGRISIENAAEVRRLMRYILDYYLDGYQLKTRKMWTTFLKGTVS